MLFLEDQCSMLTRWHKTFHILVFGSLAILAAAVFFLKSPYSTEYAGSGSKDHGNVNLRSDRSAADATEDVLGGETPEETFRMFLGALRSGDAEAASKFFILEKQEGWEKSFSMLKAGGGLEDLYTQLSRIPETWVESPTSSEAEISYKFSGDAGASTSISFNRREHSKIWKIKDL